jgi:flagellar hook-associated protein 3 FlgL
MSITGVGSRSSLIVQSLVEMRRQLDELQRQLGTGKKSDTYAGLGLDRGLAVGLRSHLTSLEAYGNAMTHVGVRLDVAQTTLGRIDEIAHRVKSSAMQSLVAIESGGQTVAQIAAYSEFGEILGLLNSQIGERYLFSGRDTDRPAVESIERIMNGEGPRAGLKQIIAERNQADLGASGLGRLLVWKPNQFSVRVEEDAVSPFGFKLAGVTSNLTNATVTPSGPPAGSTVDLTPGNPNAGDTIEFGFTLPDGSTESIKLVATTSATPGPNQFTIGPTSDMTATNLQAALTAAVGQLAGTSLAAASAIAAADDFFNIDATNPPQRVDGPPFDSATALVAGTSTDTVIWYTGEMGTDPARATATARIDTSITVSYGLRANEEGIRFLVQNIAAFAAMTFPTGDPNAAGRSAALNQRIGAALGVPPGIQKIEDIAVELAGAQTSIAAASDRHIQTKSTLADMLDQIEGVPTEQVAAQILSLQTRLQASLQTTSLLYQTSLVNYL